MLLACAIRSGRCSVRRCTAVGIRGPEWPPVACNDAQPGSDHYRFRPGHRLASAADKDSALAGPVVGSCNAGRPFPRPTHFEVAMVEDCVISRRGILLFGATLRLSAADSEFWNRKDPSEWSADEVDRLI